MTTPMLEDRTLRLDLLALGMLALAAFLALALASFDPADAPSALVYPPHARPANWCGKTGAWLAFAMFQIVGLGAYYVAASLAVVGCWLVHRQRLGEPLVRLSGWTMSLAGLTALAGLAGTAYSANVAGPGGYLGAVFAGLLRTHFATAGAWLLAASVTLCGLLLSSDYLLVRISGYLLGSPSRSLARGLAIARELRTARRSLAASAAAGESEPAVRIRGRTTTVASESSNQDDDEAAQEELDDTASDETVEVPGEESGDGALDEGVRIVTPAKRRDSERRRMLDQIEAAVRADAEARHYELPPRTLLTPSEPFSFDEHEKDVRAKAKVLERTFANFGFQVRVVEIETGPVIAQFEVELEAGLRLSKITSLADDLAIALRVPSVRIVAPIPGKNTVGIEVPNVERQLVRLREVMEESNGRINKMQIPIFLGKDVAGKAMTVDLATLPHLLIAGRTGTGKSVCLNTIIMSVLMTRRPDEVKMLLIDPKMVELTPYAKLPHLMHPVVTDMRKAEAILAWAVDKMEERYALLARAGVRHISVYNQLGEEEIRERLGVDAGDLDSVPAHLPYIVIVADEMADLMMTAAKEVEAHIIRLAQKSRAVGIHLVLATQKPTVDVITGLIKSNLPARISFQVASRTDSRVVLDEMGADKLLGNGDLLFLWPGTSTLLRGQGAYVSDEEINQAVAFVATCEPQFAAELVQLKVATGDERVDVNRNRDELYSAAVETVINEGRGSVSLLQRALGIGYGRAARLIDFMAEDGIVGQYNGSQAREVMVTLEQWQAMTAPAPPPPRSQGRIVTVAARSPDPLVEARAKPADATGGRLAAESNQRGDCNTPSDDHCDDDSVDELSEQDDEYDELNAESVELDDEADEDAVADGDGDWDLVAEDDSAGDSDAGWQGESDDRFGTLADSDLCHRDAYDQANAAADEEEASGAVAPASCDDEAPPLSVESPGADEPPFDVPYRPAMLPARHSKPRTGRRRLTGRCDPTEATADSRRASADQNRPRRLPPRRSTG